jgi:hypothetical protein
LKNAIRFWVIVYHRPARLRFLRHLLPDILAKRTDVLSPRMARIVSDLAGDWRQLDERIEAVTDEIETRAKSDDSCQQNGVRMLRSGRKPRI